MRIIRFNKEKANNWKEKQNEQLHNCILHLMLL